MKLDHHEFRMSMEMFELTPDDITGFAKWLHHINENPKDFLNKDIGYKREKYLEYTSNKGQTADSEAQLTE